MLSCRLWYDVLHSPSPHSRAAWKWANLRVDFTLHPDQREALGHSRKAAVVPDINIRFGTKHMVEFVLEAVHQGQLEKLELHLTNIPTSVDWGLLSRAVTKAQECWIFEGKPGQLKTILRGVVNTPDSTLKNLKLRGHRHELEEVCPSMLARAAVRLDNLGLRACCSAQFGEIITRLASTENSKLRELICPGSDISHLSPQIVAGALVKLKTIEDSVFGTFRNAKFTPEQIAHLFSKIKDTGDLKLTELFFSSADISQVTPEVFAGAISRLERAEIGVTPAQVQSLLTRIKLGGSKLKDLWLRSPDLSAVSTEDILGAFKMLEEVSLSGAVFTANQVRAILTMVTEGSQGRLTSLFIDYGLNYNEEDAYDLLDDETVDLLQSAQEVQLGFPLLNIDL